MANTNNRLDEKIKESLSKYKASKQTSDWSQMEEMLDKIPTSGSFKKSYLVGGIIGLAILGGGYLFFNPISNSKAPENTNAIQPVIQEENTTTPIITSPQNTVITPPEKIGSPLETVIKESSSTSKAAKSIEPTIINKEPETKSKEPNTVPAKPRQIMVMGNQPIFGDMLDSSRGIISETKEKEATKKSAIINSEKPIGWDKFINPDSLKKHTLDKRNDSLKNTPHK